MINDEQIKGIVDLVLQDNPDVECHRALSQAFNLIRDRVSIDNPNDCNSIFDQVYALARARVDDATTPFALSFILSYVYEACKTKPKKQLDFYILDMFGYFIWVNSPFDPDRPKPTIPKALLFSFAAAAVKKAIEIFPDFLVKKTEHTPKAVQTLMIMGYFLHQNNLSEGISEDILSAKFALQQTLGAISLLAKKAKTNEVMQTFIHSGLFTLINRIVTHDKQTPYFNSLRQQAFLLFANLIQIDPSWLRDAVTLIPDAFLNFIPDPNQTSKQHFDVLLQFHLTALQLPLKLKAEKKDVYIKLTLDILLSLVSLLKSFGESKWVRTSAAKIKPVLLDSLVDSSILQDTQFSNAMKNDVFLLFIKLAQSDPSWVPSVGKKYPDSHLSFTYDEISKQNASILLFICRVAIMLDFTPTFIDAVLYKTIKYDILRSFISLLGSSEQSKWVREKANDIQSFLLDVLADPVVLKDHSLRNEAFLLFVNLTQINPDLLRDAVELVPSAFLDFKPDQVSEQHLDILFKFHLTAIQLDFSPTGHGISNYKTSKFDILMSLISLLKPSDPNKWDRTKRRAIELILSNVLADPVVLENCRFKDEIQNEIFVLFVTMTKINPTWLHYAPKNCLNAFLNFTPKGVTEQHLGVLFELHVKALTPPLYAMPDSTAKMRSIVPSLIHLLAYPDRRALFYKKHQIQPLLQTLRYILTTRHALKNTLGQQPSNIDLCLDTLTYCASTFHLEQMLALMALNILFENEQSMPDQAKAIPALREFYSVFNDPERSRRAIMCTNLLELIAGRASQGVHVDPVMPPRTGEGDTSGRAGVNRAALFSHNNKQSDHPRPHTSLVTTLSLGHRTE